MSATVPEGVELVTPGDFGDELASFIRAMHANNVSPNTITAYGGAVRQFGLWLMEHDHTTDVAAIELRHVEEWIASILEHRKPATAHNRFRGLQRFMNWYETKDDDFVSPMRKLRPPRLPKLMPRVLSFDEIRAVLGTCQGGSFEGKRDDASIRVFFDTGARRREIAGLRYSPDDPDDRDVDLRRGLVHVLGKGGKDNHIALSDRTLVAVEDYLRVSKKHAHAALPWLWLGKRGRLTDSGIGQAVKDAGHEGETADPSTQAVPRAGAGCVRRPLGCHGRRLLQGIRRFIHELTRHDPKRVEHLLMRHPRRLGLRVALVRQRVPGYEIVTFGHGRECSVMGGGPPTRLRS